MAEIQLTPCQSSNVKAHGYDPETKTMRIEFHGGRVYDYADKSQEEYDALAAAERVGVHFSAVHRNSPAVRIK